MLSVRSFITAFMCVYPPLLLGKAEGAENKTNLLLNGIEALGGLDRLDNVHAVTYIGNK